MKSAVDAFEKMLGIMDELREKCPWDRVQTLESLRHLTLEETYELSDAIMEKDLDGIKKELGDLMLHIVFYAKIASEMKAFDMADVLQSINEKLVRRHPHIYGDVQVKDAGEVRDNWEKIKLTEGRDSVLGGVPHSLPALVKAYRIQEKASGVGFDWDNAGQVWEKVVEEMNEFRREVDCAEEDCDKQHLQQEFGDLLFALVNYGRFLEINPEDALEQTNRKFIRRFQYVEKGAKRSGKFLHQMSLEEMDVFWNEAKKQENQ
ncbi:MAG TPA: nucleoside triphosphate pyrophosphohydrolase [Bacteroidales bacterium]|nr:nucleoside triphosphate pyrophosphohydrolase [Bacteroidales bacterium]HPI85690.1 nucleoside triphosphate pyrophosphohydrolase [Bacteroidales bacterium]HPM91545.1 nucleoside triphosphate pyrophosphohydrolase [Bacteroidales bacterium]